MVYARESFLSKRAESQLEAIVDDSSSEKYRYIIKYLSSPYWVKESVSLEEYVYDSAERQPNSGNNLERLTNEQKNTYLNYSNVRLTTFEDIKIFFIHSSDSLVILEIVQDHDIKSSVQKMIDLDKKINLEKSELSELNRDIETTRMQLNACVVALNNIEEDKSVTPGRIWIAAVVGQLILIVVLIIVTNLST